MKLRSANIKIAQLCIIKKFGHYLLLLNFYNCIYYMNDIIPHYDSITYGVVSSM